MHLLTLTIAIIGLQFVLTGFNGHFPLLVIGLVCLALVWVLRPRFMKMPKENLISRDRCPTLYGLADRVANSVGAPGVDIIVIDRRYTAAFGRAGWRRKRVLFLGLTLFMVLDPQERVALLGHELGHCVNGDPARGLIVGSAVNSLSTWYRVLRPTRPQRRFVDMLASWLMIVLAQVPHFFTYVLLNLMWRDMQRAEYLADALAARVGGTAAALSVLYKLHLHDTVEMTIHNVAMNNRGKDLFAELQRRLANVPEHERERIRRVERLLASRLDATHPPTTYRIDMLLARPVVEPAVVLSSQDEDNIEAELKQLQPDVQAEVLDRHLAHVGSL